MIFRRCAGVVLLALLVAGGSGIGCAKNPDTTPATAAQGPAVGTGGEFVWHELITDNLASSRQFYGELLGWEFERTSRQGRPYLLATIDDRYVGGIVEVNRTPADESISQWVSYMQVENIDRALGAIGTSGGRTLVGPVLVGSGAARAALVLDSQGAPLGLLETTEDLSEVMGDSVPAGGFLWRDYLAEDVDEALSFYGRFAGYRRELEQLSDHDEHYVLLKGRGGAGLVSIESAAIESNWLPYVRVEDPGALTARVRDLGGELLLAPDSDVRGGSLAIVADPNGAVVALQKWPL
jgi:predicted enzyme related to lactoylglutathione lyase